MFKSIKKLSLILLTFILIAAAVISCGGGADETEVLTAFTELYNKSVPINEYIFGKGLPYDNPESYNIEELSSPYYVPVSESSPYKTKAELEAAILAVYSRDYYDVSMRQGLFDGYGEKNKEKPRYVEENGVLKIDITKSQLITINGAFDTSTARVKSSSATEAVVTATWKSGDTAKEYDLTMVYENGVWRMDSPTY